MAPRKQPSRCASGARARPTPGRQGHSALVGPPPVADDGLVPSDRNGLEILSRSECMGLLASAAIGRLALSLRALPVILPVNFAVVDGDIVIRTNAGTKLAAAATNAVVAFEVDGIDARYHNGWSVLVQGIAAEITQPAELVRLQQLALAPWTGADGHFVKISTRLLSGRRLHAVRAGMTPAENNA